MHNIGFLFQFGRKTVNNIEYILKNFIVLYYVMNYTNIINFHTVYSTSWDIKAISSKQKHRST